MRTHRELATRLRAGLLLGVPLAGAAVLAVAVAAQAELSFSAQASVVGGGPQYLNDTAGTTFTFRVRNTGAQPVGAVDVIRPATAWTATACPAGPAGWTRTAMGTRCRYASAAGPAGDVLTGQSADFGLTATTTAGTADRTGTWGVVVSRTNVFTPSKVTKSATAVSPGLTTKVYTWQVLDAVVADAAGTVNAACPASDQIGNAGSTVAVVVCGRNRATSAFTPVSASSSLGGSLLSGTGTFGSGSVSPAATSRVLATWSGATIVTPPATGLTVVTTIASASTRTSPPTTLTGYESVNTPPTAGDDDYSVLEEGLLTVPAADGVLGNDSDPDGNPMTAVLETDVSNGDLTLNADGSFTYDPDADFAGTDSFTYTAHDLISGSVAATVEITVTAVNDDPVILTTDTSTDEDTPVGLAVSVADVDHDGGAEQVLLSSDDGTLAVTTTGLDSATGNGTATLTITGTVPALNTALGTLTYTPSADYHATTTVLARIDDLGNTGLGGGRFMVRELTIGVSAVNDAPSFATGADETVDEDPGTQSVSGWATGITPGPADESAQTVSFDVTGNTNTALFASGPAIAPDGTLTYTPADDANGTATVTVKATDSDGAESATQTFDITVNAVNDAPSFVKGDDQTVDEDAGPQTVDPWASAISRGPSDEDGQTVHFEVTGNTNEALFADGPTIDASGVLTYTPAVDGFGTATVTVTLVDDGGGTDTSAPQSFDITVTAVNDAPSFTAGADETVDEDPGTQSVSGWATGISPGPANESAQTVSFDVTDNTNTGLFASGPAIAPDGTLTYTPADDANGTATVTLKVTDSDGAESATQTFDITVNAVNDAPSFVKGDDETVDEDAGAQSVSGWATDVSPGPGDEDGQAVHFEVTGNTNEALFADGPAIDADGALTYTPEDDAFGTATVTVTLVDDGGGTDTGAPQSFDITVTAVDDAPSFTAGADETVDEDPGTQSVSSWATGISPGPANESAQTVSFDVTDNTNTGLFASGPAVAPDGTLTYTPADDANGTATVTLKATDSDGAESATQTFDITVNAVNDAPTFTKGDDQDAVVGTGAATVTGWATAISPGAPDESGDVLTFTVTADDESLFDVAPAVDASGTLTFDPGDTLGSTDVDVYLSDDAGGQSATQTFVVNVVPPNTRPTAGPATASGAEDSTAIVVTLAGDDADGDALTFEVDEPANGEVGDPYGVSCDTNTPSHCTAKVDYRPDADYYGPDEFAYNTDDGRADSLPNDAGITVTAVNDAPSFTEGADQTVNEDTGAHSVSGWATGISAGPANEVLAGQTVSFVLTNVSDPSLFASGPSVAPDGTLSYTLNADMFGSSTVDVAVQDTGGTANPGDDDTSTAQSLTITVRAVNDAPSFTKGVDKTLDEDSGAQSVSNWATAQSKGPANESDQTLTFEVTNNTNSALFSAGPAVSPTGTLTYTTAPNAYGSATITLRLKDNGGTDNGGVDASPTQTFVITVNPVNDAPVAQAKSFTAHANMKLSLGNLLTGVTDPNDSGRAGYPSSPTFTVTPGSVVPGANCMGCTVSNVNNTAGSFDFDPPAGFTGGDVTFTYTVTDSGHPGSATSAPATITVTVVGPVIWFVDTSSLANGTGRLSAPFNSLASADAVNTDTGDRIFLYRPDANPLTATGDVSMPANGWFVSEGIGTGSSSFDGIMGISPPSGTIARPSVNGTTATVTGGVTLASGSLLQSLDLTPPSGTKGLSGSGANALNITKVKVTSTSARAVEIVDSQGSTISLGKVSSTGATSGIVLQRVNNTTAGTFAVTGDGTTAESGGVIATSTANGIDLDSVSGLSLSLMKVSGSAGHGLTATNLAGTSALTKMELSTSKGANARIVNSSGTLTLTVTDSTFKDNDATTGAEGLLVQASGTANVTFTSSGSHYDRNETAGLKIDAASSVKANVTITGGTYAGSDGTGLELVSGGTGGMAFSVTGGSVTGCATCNAGVVVTKTATGTGTGVAAMAGTIANMNLDMGGTDDNAAIAADAFGAGELRLVISNNTISNDELHGILGSFGQGAGAGQIVHVQVLGNTVTMPSSGVPLPGIRIDAGKSDPGTATVSVCADIKNNSVSSPLSADISTRIRQANAGMQLPGFVGTGSVMSDVTAYLTGRNLNNTDTTASTAGPSYTSVAGCSNP